MMKMVLDVIFKIKEDYRKIHNNWRDEIKNSTGGTSLIIIQALLMDIEYDKKEQVNNFVKLLSTYNRLNTLSHHGNETMDLKEFIDPMVKTLQLTHDLLLKCHGISKQIQQNGNFPSVVTEVAPGV
ncbi:MAG: hypothetical protein IPN09_16790 [Bacteroidetes bacterium]|nr:hypothetical protein [Bacteroidota bacterium]